MIRLAVLSLASLALITALPSHAQQLKFGYPGTPAGAFAIVANKLDVWKKHGVEVQTVQQAAAVNVRDAIVSGSLDVGFAGLSNFIVAVAAGAPMVTVGVAVDQCAASAVVVRKDSPYKKFSDLKGKRIGSEFATVTHGSFVSGMLPKNQMTPKDVQVINVRFGDMISSLLSGSVDGVTAVEPFLSQAESAGTIRILTDFCPYAPVPVVIATGQKTLKDKKAGLQKFMAALSEAAQFFADHPDDAARIYGDELRAKGFDLPAPVVAQIVKRLNISAMRIRLSPEMVKYAQEEAGRMKASGQIDTVPDMAAAMDSSLLK
jgi:ABC-type nitrate/sulfonate/bicarbonate transport system substrate-binding protein